MKKQWSDILAQLESATELRNGEYKVWFKPLRGEVDYSQSPPCLTLKAPTQYVADWHQKKSLKLINVYAKKTLGFDVQIDIIVEEEAKTFTAKDVVINSPSAPSVLATQGQNVLPLDMASTRMNPSHLSIEKMKHSHSFDTFVVGQCNMLAHAAAKSILKADSLTDMLFLSSAPGLGKTHLTQALGRAMYEESKQKKLSMAYLTTEEFSSQFIQACGFKSKGSYGALDNFKERFRALDLLLLEDVHFLRGKQKTQEELLAIVDYLQNKGARVVFTSSFAPKDIHDIDSNLSSRFNSGFITSLDYPDFDTKKEMLIKKASLKNFKLPENVADLFAKQIDGDIRLLESSLNNLLLKSQVMNLPLTEELAYSVIANVAPHNPEMSFKELIQLVCSCYNISEDQMFSRTRKNEYVMARNTAYYLIRKHFTMTLQDIGDKFNKRHSTVSKAITLVEEEISKKTKLGSQFLHTITAIEEKSNFLRKA